MIGSGLGRWLEGYFQYRNEEADTGEKVIDIVNRMKKGVVEGSVLGSFVHRIHDQPVVFVHAGYHPPFLEYLTGLLPNSSPEGIAEYVNELLVDYVKQCIDEHEEFVACTFPNDVFESGPDRGGEGLGGPFWTDFHTIQDSATATDGPLPFIQIVGHTMAWCYNPKIERDLQAYPGDDVAECGLGLIRNTPQLDTICVDGGMYAGGRTFLEIGHDGVFRSFQRTTGPDTPFVVKDLTAELCNA